MSDIAFEHRVAQLFAEPAPLPDAALFTAAVQARLERGWRRRRVMIGAAGGVGGVIAAAQVLQANLVQRASVATETADLRAHDAAQALLGRGTALLHLLAPGLSGEVLWMAAGLGAVGLALAAARLLEAI